MSLGEKNINIKIKSRFYNNMGGIMKDKKVIRHKIKEIQKQQKFHISEVRKDLSWWNYRFGVKRFKIIKTDKWYELEDQIRLLKWVLNDN